MKRVLFVCTGNTCRSPIAQGVFEKLIEKWRIRGVSCTSAGISAFSGDPASGEAVRAASEVGVDLTGHRSRLLTRPLLEQADLVVCMTQQQLNAVCAAAPEKPVVLLSHGVDDPYGGDIWRYRHCVDQVFDGMQEILECVDRI